MSTASGWPAQLISAISEKVMRLLKRMGYLDGEGEIVANPDLDPLFEDSEALTLAMHSSIAGRNG